MIITMLLERGCSEDLDEETLDKKASVPPSRLLQLLMFMVMLGLVFTVTNVHLEVSQRWKTSPDKGYSYAEKIADLKENVDVVISDAVDLTLEEIKKGIDELNNSPQAVQQAVATKVGRVLQKATAFDRDADKVINAFNDLDNKLLATEFSLLHILQHFLHLALAPHTLQADAPEGVPVLHYRPFLHHVHHHCSHHHVHEHCPDIPH